MRAKRILAVAVLLVIAFLIVFPPLMNAGVKMVLSSSSAVAAEHLYATVGKISAHRSDTSDPSGWFSVTNTSTEVDLTAVNVTVTVALGSLPLGEYDTVRLTVINATAIINSTSKKVHLETAVFTIPVSFLVQFGVQAAIMLKVAPELQEGADTVNLRLSFTAASVG